MYKQKHIPGAVYFDLSNDLSGKVELHGGRHPFPNIATFRSKLNAVGIDEETIVVAYDGGEGAFASRFWWLLTYIGHEQTFILDGGMNAWLASGASRNGSCA